ncbi:MULTISPECIES: iron-containing alcohol dehydrogenase [Pseudomonas]|uniref:Iron-containing alcohol dehydrogenase n=2 Tax=Pseudomonas petroselini TaxID=2899822 RepID=A0ABS8QQ15_9PSED|nr:MULTISPECIES: iron-containing alcohol dehydrogenase [Pseudomonas]MCD7037681.1 iron-containing alcohol dehydrogenase [Pseudomonas petroselini]MCD7046944.1 iron-containing alcohol dehydrogenase [Pseudomonas petroselini]MCD7066510.1 iron-containing alcohol dehydrogenase [Pseudomonas petroselini]MCM2380443.1 iron-containing alcohol dehydrogenase [Pseudomonas marginalis]MDD2031391.1 iron-containing alcohol dehydrogenase [Pseudomonas sp. 39167]
MTFTETERVTIGQPAREAIRDQAEKMDARRVFILASQTLRTNTDEIAAIERELGDRHAATFSGIAPHAPRTDVLRATNAAREARADLIVSIGGGSVTDAAKIVALLLKHDVRCVEEFDPLHVYVDPEGNVINPVTLGPDIRVICVPTTLSGGEFNALSGATNELMQHKQGYEHRSMAPIMVVLDPALTIYTSEQLWLSTGVRAVDHAIETLASHLSNDFADGLADSALRLLVEGLARTKADPSDLEARLKCQLGAWQSMISIIGGVPMGASHAIGHILGGTCDVPHGYTSCVMSPYVLSWNAEHDASRQVRILQCLGNTHGTASEALDALIRSLGMPRTLAEVGVGEERFQQVANNTMLDAFARTNPRPVRSPADIMEILRRAT